MAQFTKNLTKTLLSNGDVKELLQMIEQIKAENSKLKSENKEKDEELVRINLKKDEEIRRLNSKIEKYADDFKEFNDKQLQLK